MFKYVVVRPVGSGPVVDDWIDVAAFDDLTAAECFAKLDKLAVIAVEPFDYIDPEPWPVFARSAAR